MQIMFAVQTLNTRLVCSSGDTKTNKGKQLQMYVTYFK